MQGTAPFVGPKAVTAASPLASARSVEVVGNFILVSAVPGKRRGTGTARVLSNCLANTATLLLGLLRTR